jgi:hypothetical protein
MLSISATFAQLRPATAAEVRDLSGGIEPARSRGMASSDWADEETEVKAPRARPTPPDETSYELVWVEDPALGMVLQLRRVER